MYIMFLDKVHPVPTPISTIDPNSNNIIDGGNKAPLFIDCIYTSM